MEVEERIRKDTGTSKNYKWLGMVDKLSCSDITKQDAVYELNYIHALNMLGFWKQVDKIKSKK